MFVAVVGKIVIGIIIAFVLLGVLIGFVARGSK